MLHILLMLSRMNCQRWIERYSATSFSLVEEKCRSLRLYRYFSIAWTLFLLYAACSFFCYPPLLPFFYSCSPSPYLCLSLSFSRSLSLSRSLSFYRSLSFSLSRSFSRSLCLSLYLQIYLSFSRLGLARGVGVGCSSLQISSDSSYQSLSGYLREGGLGTGRSFFLMMSAIFYLALLVQSAPTSFGKPYSGFLSLSSWTVYLPKRFQAVVLSLSILRTGCRLNRKSLTSKEPPAMALYFYCLSSSPKVYLQLRKPSINKLQSWLCCSLSPFMSFLFLVLWIFFITLLTFSFSSGFYYLLFTLSRHFKMILIYNSCPSFIAIYKYKWLAFQTQKQTALIYYKSAQYLNRSQLFQVPFTEVISHAVLLNVDHLPIVFFGGQIVAGRRVEANRWPYFCFPHILANCHNETLQILVSVQVLDFVNGEVYLVVVLLVKVIEFILLRDIVLNLVSKHYSGLESPTACHIFNGIASASQEDHRHSKAFHEVQALSVAPNGKVKMTQSVLGK